MEQNKTESPTGTKSFNLYKESSDDDFNDESFSVDAKSKSSSHVSQADPLVSPNLVSKKPGFLRTTGSLKLHTHSAHKLFYGRKKDEKKNIKPITGLVRFATNMNQLDELAAKDDPYADAVLLTVEAKLNETLQVVKAHNATVADILSDWEGVTIDEPVSEKPISVPLEFKTTYGFIAAQLLGQYDKLVRLAQSAKHVGMFTDEDWARVVRKSGRMIRNVFWASSSYRYTGVRRDDIAANNQVARRAIEKYGELPQNILDGSNRGKYAPVISTATK